MASGKKKNNYIEHGGAKMLAMYPLFFILLIKIAFMTRKIGVVGMSYFAFGFVVYLFAYSLNGSMISETLRKMVIFQVNRRSVRNAIKVNRVIFEYTWILATIFGVVLFAVAGPLSNLLFGSPLVTLPIMLFAVALVLVVPQQSMKGYLEGISSQIPGIVSMFIMELIDLFTTVIIQNACMEKGKQIAALMRNDQYYYTYAAISGAIGLCVGAFFSLLFLLLITGLLKQMQKERMRNDESKSKLGANDILQSYIISSLPDFISNLFGPVLLLLCMIFMARNAKESFEEIGMFFISVIIGLPVIMNSIQQGKFTYRQIHSLLRRSDGAMARDKIASSLKANMYFSLMYSIFLIFSSNCINAFFFDQTKDSLITVFCGVQTILLLLAFALLLLDILCAYNAEWVVNLLYIVTIGMYLLFQFVFQNADMTGIAPFRNALLLSVAALLLFGGFILFKKSRFKNDWIRVFILPAIAAIGMMLVCLLIDRVLLDSMGVTTGFVLSLMLGYLSFQFIIILTHTFDKHEWNDLPFAKFPIFLAKKLNMY